MFNEGQTVHFKKAYHTDTGFFGRGEVSKVGVEGVVVEMGERTTSCCRVLFPVEKLEELTREPKGREKR